MTDFWVIRRKSDGKWLPKAEGRRGRGGTHVEPVAVPYPPRMFHTEAAAKVALTYWLQGRITVTYIKGDGWETDDDERWDTEPDPTRQRDDMEIVHVEIVFKAPLENAA